MSTFEHDLTKGNIWKQLVWFAVPFFISNLIQSLYSLIDLIILGHFGGTNSISAANIGGQVLVILTNLAAGLSGGGTAGLVCIIITFFFLFVLTHIHHSPL